MAGITRSPNYPALGLGIALNYAQLLSSKIGALQVPAIQAANSLGFAGLSGSAKVTLGALNQFGLVVRRKGRVGLSALALRLLKAESGEAFAADVRRAAHSPRLFDQVMTRLPDAADEAIVAYLIDKHSFADRGLRIFLRAYRETLELVASLPQVETQADDRPISGDATLATSMIALDADAGTAGAQSREVTSLPEGEVILQWPTNLSAESMADLENWVLFVLGRMRRRYVEPK